MLINIDTSAILLAILIFVGVPLSVMIGFTLLWIFSSNRVRVFRALGAGIGMATLTVVSLGLWWWGWNDWLVYQGADLVALLLGTLAIIGLGIWLTVLLVRWAGRKPAGPGCNRN